MTIRKYIWPSLTGITLMVLGGAVSANVSAEYCNKHFKGAERIACFEGIDTFALTSRALECSTSSGLCNALCFDSFHSNSREACNHGCEFALKECNNRDATRNS